MAGLKMRRKRGKKTKSGFPISGEPLTVFRSDQMISTILCNNEVSLCSHLLG